MKRKEILTEDIHGKPLLINLLKFGDRHKSEYYKEHYLLDYPDSKNQVWNSTQIYLITEATCNFIDQVISEFEEDRKIALDFISLLHALNTAKDSVEQKKCKSDIIDFMKSFNKNNVEFHRIVLQTFEPISQLCIGKFDGVLSLQKLQTEEKFTKEQKQQVKKIINWHFDEAIRELKIDLTEQTEHLQSEHFKTPRLSLS